MQLTAHLGGVHGAIGKLSEGIEVICAYLQGVKSGTIKKDQVLTRASRSLVRKLTRCCLIGGFVFASRPFCGKPRACATACMCARQRNQQKCCCRITMTSSWSHICLL